MGRRVSALVAGLLFVAVAAAPAGAQSTSEGERLLSLERWTPVREYAGWLVFSRWDGAAYRLSVWRAGEVRDLPVPPQREPFDADAGPDSNGRPSVVVSACAGSCDLYVIGLRPGARLRPVRNANTTGHDEVAPSVWKGRLVFARRYGPDTVVPYTKLLRAPRSRPSDRLANLPDRRCGAVDPPDCRRIEEVDLPAMELWGRWVAQSWTYQPDRFPGFRQNEIRLTDVARTDTRQLAYMTTGLGGQTYLGPSIAEGRVAFFVACHGDPAGCAHGRSGAVRYRISTGGYRQAAANEAWSGWAWSGSAAYHVASRHACGEGDPDVRAPACGIFRRSFLDWDDAPADRFR